MKTPTILAAFALVTLAGVAQSEPAQPSDMDESAFKLDLEDATGHTYFLHCQNGQNILDCDEPSLWENENDLPGLQTTDVLYRAVLFKPDAQLLG